MKHHSKWLSYILRHAPHDIKLKFDPEGWLNIEEIFLNSTLTRPVLETILADDKKGKVRFELDASGESIRARYGHSALILRDYPLSTDPVLYHGTQRRFLPQILVDGLKPMSRQYVHLTSDPGMAQVVGKRRGSDIVMLRIDTDAMRRDGLNLYDAGLNVVLTESVPAQYLTVQ